MSRVRRHVKTNRLGKRYTVRAHNRLSKSNRSAALMGLRKDISIHLSDLGTEVFSGIIKDRRSDIEIATFARDRSMREVAGLQQSLANLRLRATNTWQSRQVIKQAEERLADTYYSIKHADRSIDRLTDEITVLERLKTRSKWLG